MVSLIDWWNRYDTYIYNYLDSGPFTKNLVTNNTSKVITEIFILGFIVVFNYETIYWSGIYLGLWEYHAKDIFKEIPVHCAHLYVRVNVVSKENLGKVREFYSLKRKSRYNIFEWRRLNKMAEDIMTFKNYVKYYFEFGPDDFAMNEEPDYGSTLIHLKGRILEVFNESKLFAEYRGKTINEENVLVFNNRLDELRETDNKNYLSKLRIETGNVIDTIVVY